MLTQADGPFLQKTPFNFPSLLQSCDNCQYDSTCCCPPRNALPVISVRTSVKLKRTTKTTVVLKTVVVATRILTRTAGKVAGRRGFLEEPEIGSFSEGEPVAGQDELVQDDAPTEDEAEDYSTEHVQLEARSLPSEPIQPISPYESISSNTDTISQIHQLAPRHGLCRACPSGTSVLPRSRPGRSYDWSSLQACCPSRRTILRTTVRTKLATKLIKVTKRVRRTLTRTFTTVQGAKQTVTGRLFVDTNKYVFFLFSALFSCSMFPKSTSPSLHSTPSKLETAYTNQASTTPTTAPRSFSASKPTPK